MVSLPYGFVIDLLWLQWSMKTIYTIKTLYACGGMVCLCGGVYSYWIVVYRFRINVSTPHVFYSVVFCWLVFIQKPFHLQPKALTWPLFGFLSECSVMTCGLFGSLTCCHWVQNQTNCAFKGWVWNLIVLMFGQPLGLAEHNLLLSLPRVWLKKLTKLQRPWCPCLMMMPVAWTCLMPPATGWTSSQAAEVFTGNWWVPWFLRQFISKPVGMILHEILLYFENW